jgi:hypothetical protein
MYWTSAPLVNLLRQAECKIQITPEGSISDEDLHPPIQPVEE